MQTLEQTITMQVMETSRIGTSACKSCSSIIVDNGDPNDGEMSEADWARECGWCLRCWSELLGDCEVCGKHCFIGEDRYEDERQWCSNHPRSH